MKKLLLFLLIFTPISSLFAENCEIKLHTGALWRGGTYVFPKGAKIQNLSLRYDNNDNSIERDECPSYLHHLQGTLGSRWTQGVNNGTIKMIGDSCNASNTSQYIFTNAKLRFTLSPTSIGKDRSVEHYPIDYQNASLYLTSVRNTSSGLVFPRIFGFSSLLAPEFGFEGTSSDYKVCTLDQEKLAEIGGFHIENPQTSYVLVPYYALEIPKEYSGEELVMGNRSYDIIKEYSEPYYQDGKPHLPIEYKK